MSFGPGVALMRPTSWMGPTPVVGQHLTRRLRQLLVEQANPPARRPLRKVEQLEKRSLTRAGWPGEEIEAAVVEPEVEVAQDLGPGSVPQPDAIELRDLRQLLLPPPPPCQARRIPVYPPLRVLQGLLPV